MEAPELGEWGHGKSHTRTQAAAPPPLRSSLYQVAATIPGVDLVGTVKGRAGRAGTAVAADRTGQRLERIFDPNTSALLAQETVRTQTVDDTTAPPGTVVSYTLYLRSGIVSSSSVTSAGR